MEDDLTFPQIVNGLSVPIVTTTADGRVDFANRQLLDYLGMSLDELKNWETSGAIHPDDLPRVVTEWRQSVERGQPYEGEQRIRRADGVYQWVRVRGLPLRDTHNRILRWCVLLADIAERKRAEALLDGEKSLLEKVASGCPLEEVLDAMCGIVDTLISNSACSILLIDPNGKFRHGAGPTLPPGYEGTVNGAPVACEAGPCGTAASLKEQVIVPDLASDSRWVGLGWRTLALEHGLRSVCSTPILSLTGKVLGTFAIYKREPEPPTALLRDLITRFTHVASIAIERTISERDLRERERESRMVVNTIPGLVSTFSPSGEIEILNHRMLEYFGKPMEEMRNWAENNVIHPKDLPRAVRLFSQAIASEEPLEYEARLRRFDAVYRWFQVRAFPARDSTGRVVRWYTLVTDIDDLKSVQKVLTNRESNLRSIIDAIPTMAWTTAPDGSCEFLNQRWLDYAGMTAEQALGWGWAQVIHPDDRAGITEYWRSALAAGAPVEAEARMRRFDGSYRWFLFRASPVRDESQNIIKWYGANIDIEDRKRGEAALRASELSWRQIVDNIPGLVATMGPTGEVEFLNRQTLDYFGKTNEELKNWSLIGVVHPDDLPRVIEARAKSIEAGQIYEIEHRCLGADGVYRWFQVRGLPVRNAEDAVTAWYLLLTDIDDRKKAEEQIKKSEAKLRQVVDAIPALAWCNLPDGSNEFLNQGWHEYTGLSPNDSNGWGWQVAFHPKDLPPLLEKWREMLVSGEPGEIEARLRRHDGVYRWFLIRAEPFRNESGEIVRWYGTSTDIEDRKSAEAELRELKDRLYQENLVLRDEVDRTSMFEEIVGTSPALKPVLARIAKVAQTDSTVLITGETGTGKELVARAIHRRSPRSGHSFVSVNCAAVPRELIASELFGHEKGAFTGATQRRLGRFELAHKGTIFLDEVGELPMETQVALLRVLQERGFERVGGSTSIQVDVRVIAATNRDLQAAIQAGTFRGDLFYRLNVFPIQVPALRERADDISVLLEYFIDRYARKSGKTIRRVNKRTLDQLRSYPWPGNVRELQNVIERSVILCDTGEFKVDESWLSARPSIEGRVALSGTLDAHEKAIIEDALRASGGRVFGSSGAAARLGIPRSTLESKIRALKINKNSFRPQSAKP